MANTPKKPDSNQNGSNDDGKSQILNVANLHYHGNDLKELRKLAEVNPELAYKVLETENQKDQRFNISFRFGLVSSSVILIVAIVGVLTAVFLSGWIATLLMIGFILATALLVRVILTGQWSDTSWFGKLVGSIAKTLGSEKYNTDSAE